MSYELVVQQAKEAITANNYHEAVHLLKPLLEQGTVEAEFLFGFLYFAEIGITKTEARAWMEKASAQEHPAACYCLACGLSFSDDYRPRLPIDLPSWALLKKAADLGLSDAQRDLGYCYSIGCFEVPQNATETREWYTRAARQRDPKAQLDLAKLYLEGIGGQVDVQEA